MARKNGKTLRQIDLITKERRKGIIDGTEKTTRRIRKTQKGRRRTKIKRARRREIEIRRNIETTIRTRKVEITRGGKTIAISIRS